MSKSIRVFGMVMVFLAVCMGSVSAYNRDEKTIQCTLNGETATYTTKANLVGDFLDENNILLTSNDTISKKTTEELKDGDMLVIDQAMTVVVALDGVPRMVQTKEETVGGLLSSMEQSIGSEYRLKNAAESDRLNGNETIMLTSTNVKTYSKSESIPFETIIKETDALAYGTERVVQEGSYGEIEITYKEIYEGSELVSTEEVSRNVVREAVNTVIEKGTAKAVKTSAGSINYSKALNVTATGYTPYDPGCTGITASGVPAGPGNVAVDPRVIPMGSKLYIPGYGMAVATDTGGAIKGNKIDLCYNTTNEAFAWGVRNVTVYILE